MEKSTIEENMRYLLIKKEYKTMEKLFNLHKNKKISTKEFKEMMLLHKPKLLNTLKSISELSKQIDVPNDLTQEKNKEFLICEYFLYKNYFQTAELYIKKHDLSINISFYLRLKSITDKMLNGEIEDALAFYKTNKLHLKGINKGMNVINGIELETQLQILEFLVLCKNDKISAIKYAQSKFSKSIDNLSEYLPAIANPNLIERNEVFKKAAENFRKIFFMLYRQPLLPRLVKRIEFGLVAYKTQYCGIKINPKCPACLKITEKARDSLPTCEREFSIILCKATGKVMDESNQAYAFETGYIYSNEYIQDASFENVCKETGVVCKSDPKICYFV
ncbi:hypothetical protein EDEG_00299 [Edhazardia aedis USNM 41457]|uniref:CTLH domain-containing protein n=1 Tax=Edhazardia aedis (strain USNM 41457) TaxID=1003232 RepID=J9DLR8_EDHAE|nr:hypothetical protein EDEG_00299 [Edhazardia aedis USNM 41457]|eukprot:EJW02322.1 hypothetical protein EDEG_00299 [Edhazardia aedis USNM 41457]